MIKFLGLILHESQEMKALSRGVCHIRKNVYSLFVENTELEQTTTGGSAYNGDGKREIISCRGRQVMNNGYA